MSARNDFCACLAALLALSVSGAAMAQAVERNLPTPEKAPGGPALSAPALTLSDDDKPLGPPLAGVVLLGAGEAINSGGESGGGAGIDATRLPPEAARAVAARLKRLVGKPLSRRLISRVQAATTEAYRALGRPFVSVVVPPQDVSTGVLRLRVVEYRLEDVRVTGVEGRAARYVRSRVRQKAGRLVDAPRLETDLDWLNRDPFRQVGAVFAPGKEPGTTTLTLEVTQARPLAVYAGYSNSGTHSTGFDRYFTGFTLGDAVIPGALLSYQFSGSKDAWYNGRDYLQFRTHPSYLSHGAVLDVPLAPRQELSFTLSAVETNQPVQAFVVRQSFIELSAVYKTALGNFLPLPGDVSLGVEAKRQDRNVFFGATKVVASPADVGQFVASWTASTGGVWGRGNITLSERYSPGGFGAHGDDADYSAATTGRVTSANYLYTSLALNAAFRLPKGLVLETALTGQYSPRPLLATEQAGIGGEGGARVYTNDDGAFDQSLVWRNTLRVPQIPLVPKWVNGITLSPYLFVDGAYGRSVGVTGHVSAADAGLGADLQVTRHLRASFNGGWAMQDAPATRAGDFRLNTRITTSF